MKISIIVPIYNVDTYLKRCLDSLINQTYQNIEIILINDGSTDLSKDICLKYVAMDNRIKFIDSTNKGVSKARNSGLDMATGDYIMFVDPDDFIELSTCSILMKYLKENDKDVVIFNFFKNDKKNNAYNYEINNKYDVYELQASILDPTHNPNLKGVGFTWNKIIKKDFLETTKIKFLMEYKKAIFEDCLFYYQLFDKTTKIGIINEYLYHYNVLDNSATRKYNDQIIEINEIIYDSIMNLSNNHVHDEKYFDSLYIRMINNFCFVLDLYICNKQSKLNYTEKRKTIKKLLERKEYKVPIKCVSKNKQTRKKLRVYASLARFKAVTLIIITNYFEKHIKKKRR